MNAPIQSAGDSRIKNKRRTRLLSSQYLAYLIHSFVGLKLNLILVLVLASGTLAVVSQEIDWLTLPEMRVTPQETRLDSGELLDRLEAAYPNAGMTGFTPNEQHPYTAAVARFNDDQGGFRFAWIDPYTGDVQGDTVLLTAGRFLSFLHATLYLPVIGRSLVNAFGLLTLISLVAGLIAYPKFWRFFLQKPRTGNLRVFMADLHKLIGLWSIWFLLVIGITGTWWFYQMPFVKYADAPKLHEPYPRRPLLSYDEIEKIGTETPKALSAKEIVAMVKDKYPDLKIRMLSSPEHNADPFEVTGSLGEWLVNPGATNKFYVNPYTGDIIEERLVANYTPMQRTDLAMGPLHFGTFAVSGAADLGVKAIWFIFGALMTALAVTGLIINVKRTRRAKRIAQRRSPTLRRLIKTWNIVKPWGKPFGIFKYINVLMLVGVCMGTGIAFTLSSQGVKGSGYEYSSKALGPWQVKLNAYAGLLEKDLPPIRPGINTNFSVELPQAAYDTIKFSYVRVGKPRTLRSPGTLIQGPIGAKGAAFRLPKRIKDDAELWLTAITWEGEVLQTKWPLLPDDKETFDVR